MLRATSNVEIPAGPESVPVQATFTRCVEPLSVVPERRPVRAPFVVGADRSDLIVITFDATEGLPARSVTAPAGKDTVKVPLRRTSCFVRNSYEASCPS